MKKIILILITGILLLALTIVAGAVSTTPGSEDDPVVTKSYVDSQIAELKSNNTTAETFKAIEVKAGQKLIGSEGTEIILRSGEAKAIDNGANGVSDISDGKDLMTGYWVYPNHLLLTPRDDGRGISATTDIWVMVRGSYTIQ
ncbi:hypothetical protein [Anaerovorax odorimutans]|uniref:hypothetical protein n=1 Tax=Anaerovorax odorimutans TaxID=109327 RepID=UPI000400E325|nr:hypothetical protein [Anaerovorax odorimutans]